MINLQPSSQNLSQITKNFPASWEGLLVFSHSFLVCICINSRESLNPDHNTSTYLNITFVYYIPKPFTSAHAHLHSFV